MPNPVGRPPKFNNVKEMQEAIDAYFSECDSIGEHGRPYTMSGIAYALDMSRQALLDYANKDEFLDAIKKARQRVEIDVENRLMSGSAVAGAIFNLKNNFGWRDKTEVEQHNYNHESALDELE
jgi:hypothetical protein